MYKTESQNSQTLLELTNDIRAKEKFVEHKDEE